MGAAVAIARGPSLCKGEAPQSPALVSNFYIIVSGGGEVYATYVPALSGQLLRVLVGGITLHRGEGMKTTVVITYRFGPPDDRSEEFHKERSKL
jgi:hypothetical protein